uniref:Putative secreted protein n=1 Tax=Ixodes ricinus TaxID=34613 RepID=A0A6B0TWW0_IXORI
MAGCRRTLLTGNCAVISASLSLAAITSLAGKHDLKIALFQLFLDVPRKLAHSLFSPDMLSILGGLFLQKFKICFHTV